MIDFARRVLGAMRLDPATFEEVEADPKALPQAGVVVLAFSIAAGIGLAGTASTPRVLIVAIVASFTGWISWASLVYYLGTHVFPEAQTRADIGQLARTIGFSAAPGLFLALLVIPVVRGLTFAAVSLWMLAAMVIAVRQALDFTGTARAVAVCLAGWILAVLIALVVGFAFGPSVS